MTTGSDVITSSIPRVSLASRSSLLHRCWCGQVHILASVISGTNSISSQYTSGNWEASYCSCGLFTIKP